MMLKFILFGLFLVLHGLSLLGVTFGGALFSMIAGISGVIAGILFLINR